MSEDGTTTPRAAGARTPDRPGADRLVPVSMWAAIVGYVTAAMFARDPRAAELSAGIGLAIVGLPVAVAWRAARRSATPGARFATGALGAFSLGLLLNGLEFLITGTVHFPSWGDGGYVAFYVLLPLALRRTTRGRVGVMSPVAALDGLIAALGLAAVLSVRIAPFIVATHDRIGPATFVALAYPLLDLLLVGALVWLVAVSADAVPGWSWLVAGLVLLALSDTAFALSSANPLQLLTGAAQIGWALGLASIAQWVVRLAQAPAVETARTPFPAESELRRSARTAAFSAAGASLAVLVVLVLSARERLPVPAVVLAATTVLASAVRTQVGYRVIVTARTLQAQAHTDELTGLPNRRALRTEAARVLGAGGGGSHAVLVLDLDGFKEVNDARGHDVGDRVLTAVAARIARSVRQSDLVARTGGDEFAVLMPGADRTTAMAVARRIAAEVDAPIALGGRPARVATSVGVAVYPEHGEDMSTLMRHADRAMYAAKSTGTGVRVAETRMPVLPEPVDPAD